MTRRQSRLIRYGLMALLGLAACSVEANAQTNSGRAASAGGTTPVACGLLIGINSASLTFPPVPAEVTSTGFSLTVGRHTGLVGGLVVAQPAGARATFETGLLASVRGATVTVAVPGVGTLMSDLRVIYLDVPLHGRVRLAQTSHTRTFLLAGPTVGFKLHARGQVQGMGILGTESEPVDTRRVDFGVVIGARVEAGHALVDVRYTHGLNNVAPESGPGGETVRYRVVSVMGGWRFGAR